MKRLTSLLLAIFMIWGLTARVFATPLPEDTTEDPNDLAGFDDIMPASITPSGVARHEYRFYASEADADEAEGGDNTITPLDTKFVRTDGMLENRKLLEKKDELFAGWFYKENGVENLVKFGKQGWIGEDKTIYAYPKRSKVIVVFFSHGSVVLKSAIPDADGHVSISFQPGVGLEGKVLKGWSIDQSFDTVADAEAAGKLFHFTEDAANATEVTGTLMLHAIFEDAIRVSFNTQGAGALNGQFIKTSADKVKVPDLTGVEKVGYTFDHWYVLEDDPDSAAGQKEVKLTTISENGADYFDYEFTKDTVVNIKWKGKEVPFNIVFMIEKRPDQIGPDGEQYSFLGYFKNENNPDLQITKGIAGSEIIFDNDSLITVGPDRVTSLDKDQFKSYLEEPLPANNLLKYADLMGIEQDVLKGFHVNKQKTNENNPIVEGNGLGTKIVYLDRDTVNLRVVKGGKVVDDETKHPDALGSFKYGQILLEKDANRGWNYLFNNYIYKENKWRYLGNYITGYNQAIFSVSPFAVEEVTNGEYKAKYMKRDGNAWVFEFYDRDNLGGEYTMITIPLRLPADKQELPYDQAKQWIKDENVENLKNQLLPNKEIPMIGRMGGMPYWMYLQAEDYPLINGYETINTTIPGEDRPGGRPEGATPSLKDNLSIFKLKEVAGIQETGKYLVMPIIYKKLKFDLQFETKATGDIASQTINDIPYNCVIVEPQGPGGGDLAIPEKQKEVEEYLAKFIKAEINPDTKEVTNLETVTKNQDGHLFMGWYLDPGFTIPFDKHMPMPAQNLQVFAKWEPLYHYIIVHHIPYGINGVNNPENITELKIAHEDFLNAQDDLLKNPPILSGRARSDFRGWETYGDVIKEDPSSDGITGGPFLYKFDKPVTKAFHLYPRWYINKVGVVYAYNFNEDANNPLQEGEIAEIMANIDETGPDAALDKDNYYMSEYKYLLGSKVRLRAPLGWDNGGNIIEPVAPEGTNAAGKVFIGWKVRYRDKSEPFAWHTVDDLVYYNSEIEFSENNITHRSDAKRGEGIGVIVLEAQWGEEKINTILTLHRNHDADDAFIKEYDPIEIINKDWQLPDAEDVADFKREGYKFLGWNEARDGNGRMYQAGENIYIDETHATKANHLYAQWERIKDIVEKPIIDNVAKGDTSVKIDPPENGNTLEVTFPGDKTVTLTKDDNGIWTDKDGNQVTVTDGKVEVPVPDNGTLNVGDTITAQGKDSTGILADSLVDKVTVGQSNKVTPRPQFAGIAEGDTSFKIRPVDRETEGIITDKLVITINKNDDENSLPQQIILRKTADGKWTDENNVTYVPDAEGYLTLKSSVTLTQDFSLAATGEDTTHGHLTSVPAGRSIKAKPCDSGTPGQGGTTEIYLPGNKWTPDNINLIKQLKLKQAPAKITPAMTRLPATGDNTGTTTYLSMLALLLGLVGLCLARRRS